MPERASFLEADGVKALQDTQAPRRKESRKRSKSPGFRADDRDSPAGEAPERHRYKHRGLETPNPNLGVLSLCDPSFALCEIGERVMGNPYSLSNCNL